jgi:uncharacterized membrane protein
METTAEASFLLERWSPGVPFGKIQYFSYMGYGIMGILKPMEIPCAYRRKLHTGLKKAIGTCCVKVVF